MPSVFKLSLSMKRTRPCTLGGKQAMISTDAGGFGLLWARRTAVPAARSAKFFGAQINPASALAATTAGEPKYTYASRFRLFAPDRALGRCKHRTRAAMLSRPRPAAFANRRSIPISLALRRLREPDKIPHRRQRGRPWRARLQQRHANPRNARSRMTINTPSE